MKYSEKIARATQLLNSAKNAILVEINEYPTPIAGCDAQFNHLLAIANQNWCCFKKTPARCFNSNTTTIKSWR